MGKFRFVYEGELDTGDLPSWAFANMYQNLMELENNQDTGFEANVWEIFNAGEIKLVEVEDITKEKK